MKNSGTYFFYGGVFVIITILILVGLKFNKPTASTKENNISKTIKKDIKTIPAEKIQIFLFYATQRCTSCTTIGKYVKETIEQKFPEELKSGKIEFREINSDLPENKELATKFKATGSALFINSIIAGKDNIKVDTQVWKLISNEQSFISYLSDKINTIL